MDLDQRLNVTKIDTGAVSENSLSRRTFLKVSAAAGGGLLLSFILPRTILSRETAGATTADVFVPNAFIRIGRDGWVTLIMPYVEMGQGTYTSIPMLIAEELEVDLTQVTLEAAPPDERHYANSIFQIQATGGSTSVRAAWEPLRLAGATARMMLVSAAAQNWKVDPTACHAEKGEVIHATSGRRLKYGALVDTVAMLPIPDRVVLKASENFTLIGTSAKRLDTPDKVNGKAQFSIDVMIPGMKIATVAACPVFGGRLVGVDDSNAKRIKGVQQVVLLDNAVAVIADHMWAAKQGLAALDIQWDEGPNATLSSAEIVRQLEAALLKPGVIARKDGDVAKAMAEAATKVEALYQMPFLTHATMEPLSCTMHVRKNGCDVWVGSQVLAHAQATVADVTGLPLEKILVHNQLLGGGFGRRLEVDFITQAAQIAKQVDGPVKVVWTREEDIQHDIYRPYYCDRMVAGLDEGGMPVAWSHRSAGSSIYARWHPPAFKDGLDPDVLEGAAEPPPPYALPNMLVEYVRQEPPGIPTGFWRGVGPTHNVFVVESFIDELAAAAKKDPVAYRLALLGKSPRAKAVLELAAEKAGWGQPLPEGHGRGVSVQFVFGSYVAQIVDVRVAKNSEVRVTRVVCTVDCGVVVNPDTVKAQMESGIGEPGTSALAPALTNAIFAATGTRIRKLPVNRVELRSAKR